ncbi:hypothetical protein ABZ826_23425 [Streptomyces sp. NPDC047515]|uniref:hypothetical protein n=1 Tax=Streptomyces sp. NPDC047515 TaxID=3155380 RepID=UPI0033D9C4CB
MKALTIRQPYADAIVHGHHTHGYKRTENRSRPIPPKYLGQTILIHAAKAPHPAAEIWGPRPDVRSALLATAVLTSCHFDGAGCCAPWGMPNWFHWQLDDVQPLTTPVPASGQLGFWTPPDNVLAAVPEAPTR